MVQARHQAFERSTITHGRWQYSFKMRDTVLCETKQHRSTLPEKHVGEVDACHRTVFHAVFASLCRL